MTKQFNKEEIKMKCKQTSWTVRIREFLFKIGLDDNCPTCGGKLLKSGYPKGALFLEQRYKCTNGCSDNR